MRNKDGTFKKGTPAHNKKLDWKLCDCGSGKKVTTKHGCYVCYNKFYYHKDKQRAILAVSEWKLKNKDKVARNSKKYAEKNRERILKYQRIWRAKNPEKSKERYQKHKERGRLYREKNKEKIRERSRKYVIKKYRENTDYKITSNLRRRLHSALKGRNKSKRTLAYLGCSLEEWRNHLQSKFRDGMTWENYGKWHVDHIKPVSSFNLQDEAEVEKCFNYKNTQPLWELENLIKHNKII